jgi:hypothetical protein
MSWPTPSRRIGRRALCMSSPLPGHRPPDFTSCTMIFDGPTATYTCSVEGWPLMMPSLKSLLETAKPLATK